MTDKELLQKLHEAVDLINRARETGLDVDVNIEIKNGPEKLRVSVSDSVSNDGTYYVSGYYEPEGRR